MKLLIKKHSKVVLFAGVLLFSCEAFSASEATKQLIHETLAKYGISAGGKLDCNTDKEPYYDKKTGKVRCYNNDGYYKQNCWDKESRLCKECPAGTLVNKRNYSYCNKIICPDGFMLIKVQSKDSCPSGFIAKKIISSDSCPSYTFSYDEITATNNYNSSGYNCKTLVKQ